MQLSQNFSLQELTHTNHKLDNTPSSEDVERLKRLAIEVLQPIRARFGIIFISSGFRSTELNKAVGGAKNSAHLTGDAADFGLADQSVSLDEVMDWIINESSIEYDQVIHEGAWIHIGQARKGRKNEPRKQALRKTPNGYEKYEGSSK